MKNELKEKRHIAVALKDVSVNKQDRTFKAIITDETVDHSRDVIDSMGINVKTFKKNGPIFFNHDRNLLLGSATDIKRVGKTHVVTAKFADEGTDVFIDKIYKLVKQGHLKTMSIGFRPIDNPRRPTKEDYAKYGKSVEWVYGKILLLEASIVTLPDNENATILACKELDIDPKTIMGDDYIEAEETEEKGILNVKVAINEESIKKLEEAESTEDLPEEIILDIDGKEFASIKTDKMTKEIDEEIEIIEELIEETKELSEKDILVAKIKKELGIQLANKEVEIQIKEELSKWIAKENGLLYW